MSTLKTNTIQHLTSGFNNVVQFVDGAGTQNGTLCRAWVNFNGTFGTSPFTIANGGIRAAFNVSSVTDNGTGDYTVNYSSALSDANYSFQATASQAGTGNNGFACTILDTSAPSTTATRFRTQQDNVGVTDPVYTNVAVFR
jgi:hypothetical protein